MKAILRETKTNPQKTNREGKGAGIQINDLEHKNKINIQPKQNEEKNSKNEFKKTLGHLQKGQYPNHRDARRRRGRERN